MSSNTVIGYGDAGYGEYGYGGVDPAIQAKLDYYLSLLTSEYQSSPKILAWLAALLTPFLDIAACVSTVYRAFDLNTAVGVQLDVLGQLVGASRVLPFMPTQVSTTLSAPITVLGSQTFTVGSTSGMAIGQALTVDTGGAQESVVISDFISGNPVAIFAKAHAAGVPVTAVVSSTLGDSDYRTLIKAKIAQNQWDGQADSLWDLWKQLFPGGAIYITDNQNMTATVILTGSFSSIAQQMITNGMIVPRPEAVQYTYLFNTLPLFGFDNLNPLIVAGFDIGHWA